MRCAPLCGCNAGYRTAIPGRKEFNVTFRHNLRERKTRRSVHVCAEYRPPGSTLGYRLTVRKRKGRFTLKLNRPPQGAMLRPQSRPKHAGCAARHYNRESPRVRPSAYSREYARVIMRGNCRTDAVFRRFSANLHQRSSSRSAPLELLSLSMPPADDGCFLAKGRR